ncbi:MAG: hypothetical protein C5B50_27020 [Verrucomicrobia bacterium]|nr:MAG: hypothetical protein C5B50_27020 [Verrucomicrobiota bacterium]
MNANKRLLVARNGMRPSGLSLGLAVALLAASGMAWQLASTKPRSAKAPGPASRAQAMDSSHARMLAGTADRADGMDGSQPIAATQPPLAGMIVYIDTNTGWFGIPPSNVVAALTSSNAAFSTSGAGLVESNSPHAGGGRMINLVGRFQNAMEAKVGPDGKLTTSCGVPAQPHAAQDEVQTKQPHNDGKGRGE